jgi:hypothetical protein
VNDTKATNFDRLVEQTERYLSLEKLQLYRNMYFGAGAACFVLVSQLATTGSLTVWLKWSLLSAAVSMPIWLGLGSLFEYYIMLGPKSYAHKRTGFANALLSSLMLLGGLSLVASISLLLYHSLPIAAYSFLATIAAILIASALFHGHLASWYFGKGSNNDGAAST